MNAPNYRVRNFLTAVAVLRDKIAEPDAYPFSIPAIGALREIEFEQPVTFFIGENGSGKSTLLEAIAVRWGLNPEGGSRNFSFSTRASHSSLKDYLRLVRSPRRMRDSFFLRAESYFNVATQIDQLDEDPLAGPSIIRHYGGRSLHEQSHGESFFALFMNRFGGDGFYILDEPEAALSPARQMEFLKLLRRMEESTICQVVMATHSPMLMAYPGARLLRLSKYGLEAVTVKDTDHYKVMREFCADPAGFVEAVIAE